jgi:hypothetical protein
LFLFVDFVSNDELVSHVVAAHPTLPRLFPTRGRQSAVNFTKELHVSKLYQRS